jgi:dipeptidyl-peptidase-4
MRAKYTTRKLLLIALVALQAYGQKKPVTLETLNDYRGGTPRGLPGEPVCAPDGKTFLFRQRSQLRLYDVAKKQARDLLDLGPLDAVAVTPPSAERYEWENRRVDEESLQWDARGKQVLYFSDGDIFLIDVADGQWKQLTKTAIAERDPKFSPDGKRISFRRNWDLYVMNLADGTETRLTANGSDALRNGGLDWVYPEELSLGTAYWWSPDAKSIAYLQFDVSKEPLYPHEDLRGSRPVYEPQRYPKAGENNPQVRLGVVAAIGGATRWLDVGDTVQASLIARAGWSDATHVYVVRTNRIQNQLEILLFDDASTAARVVNKEVVYQEKDPFWINVEGDPVFLRDGKRFVWTSERDGFRHVYLFSVDGGEPKQLTRGTWVVSDVVGVDERAGRVYFRSTEDSPLERQLYSVKLDGTDKRRVTKGAGTHRVIMAPGCKTFLDVYSNLASPPEATLHTAAGDAIAIYRPGDRRAQEQFDYLPTEIVEFKSRSGVTFYATLIKPAGFDPAKKYPVFVNVYGGPHAQAVRNAWPGFGADQVYAHKGYVVWQMDNRGTAGRGHAFETPVFRKLGTVEAADQREGIEHLISMGFVDPTRIGVNGWSYGGFMTLNLLLNANDLVRAGFAGAPVTDWRNYDSIYTERYMGLPADNQEGYAAAALPAQVGKLRGRLMMAHNVEDDNVLFQNTLQMISALEAAGKQFELALYPQKTHNVSGAAARQLETTMLDFFERSLKPAIPGEGRP